MKRLVVGLLAHVDSGKTTLAEGLLYRAGVLRKLGVWTTGTPFWTPTPRSGRGASRFLPSRRC